MTTIIGKDGTEYIFNNGILTMNGTGQPTSISHGIITDANDNTTDLRLAITQVIFGEGITAGPGEGFYQCSNLESVQLPESLTVSGGTVFMYCSKLREIVFPSSLTAISAYCFYGCTKMQTIIFRGPVVTVGSRAFQGIDSPITIYSSGWANDTIFTSNVISGTVNYVAGVPITYFKMKINGTPVQADSAVRDEEGYRFKTAYAKKSELFSGSYTDLTDKPSLATVATSGSYNDLSNKPSIPQFTLVATNITEADQ